MERDLDYSADDPWKYQFTKYPNPDDPEAYKHDEGQKCAVLDIIAASANAAQGDEPFSKGSGEALKRITANAVFGEYKTDSSGEVKSAFDDMRAAWGHCLDRTARAFPPAAELAVEAREAQDEFFDAWYDLANVFRYPDFGAYQGYEYFMCIRHFGAYAALANKLRVRLKAIQAVPQADNTLTRIEQKLDAARKDHADIQADTTGTAMKVANIGNGVGWLVGEEKRKQQKRAKNGKESQAKGNTEERKRAARDMKTALNRVHDRMKNGAPNLLAVCRKVCEKFLPLTSRKNALGEYAEYAPLTGAGGKPILPETLAKNYRDRYGTKKERKARAAKAKRRTK